MPTTYIPDPLSAGADAAGAVLSSSAANRDKAAATAAALDQQKWERTQTEQAAQRDEERLALQAQQTESTIAETKQRMAIEAATEAFRKTMEPLTIAAAKLSVQVQRGQVDAAALDKKIKEQQLIADRLTNQLKAKYGDQAAELGIQQAQANLAQTYAQNRATEAATANTIASTAYTNKETALLGTYGASTKGDDPGADYSRLSPEAQKLWTLLYSIPPVAAGTKPGEATGGVPQRDFAHMAQIINGQTNLSATDKQIMLHMLKGKESPALTAASSATQQSEYDTHGRVADHQQGADEIRDGNAVYNNLVQGISPAVRTQPGVGPALENLRKSLIANHGDMDVVKQNLEVHAKEQTPVGNDARMLLKLIWGIQ